MQEELLKDLDDAYPVLKSFVGDAHPACAIVLGSGINPYADALEDTTALSYAEVPHMHVSTAEGHKGQFVLGRVPGTNRIVLCMQGRLHGYEGLTAQEVAFPIWLIARVGINVLVTTNAAGAINPTYSVGDFCLMKDHINFMPHNPIAGVEPNKIADRFVPMVNAYDAELRRHMSEAAYTCNVSLREGVYLALPGPSFETPAEISLFSKLGADTVAMSVVEEVIAARHVGMRVCGMSLVSNMAAGIAGSDPSSAEVMDVAASRIGDFTRLMNTFVAKAFKSSK